MGLDPVYPGEGSAEMPPSPHRRVLYFFSGGIF